MRLVATISGGGPWWAGRPTIVGTCDRCGVMMEIDATLDARTNAPRVRRWHERTLCPGAREVR